MVNAIFIDFRVEKSILKSKKVFKQNLIYKFYDQWKSTMNEALSFPTSTFISDFFLKNLQDQMSDIKSF